MNQQQPTKELLARALRELRELRQQVTELEQEKAAAGPAPEREQPIAVIGLACRFPGRADGPEAYWQMLAEGVDAVGEVPADRWDIDRLYDPDPEVAGKMMTRMGGFIEDVARFDPTFFGIAPREAAAMDPQQRLLLELSWQGLEHAGQPIDRLGGRRPGSAADAAKQTVTGVFVGIASNDYVQLMLSQLDLSQIDAYSLTGNAPNVAAGRIAYALGLQGPAMAVDTACSSSLVAAHLACQSLRSGECDLALAGGVNLILSPVNTIAFSRMKAMAPDGRCKTFDAGADGYVRGEGAGMVVLKRLADAQANGDHILAVIRGSAVNQDGRSSGLTVPNGPAQQAVISQALERAGVRPEEVGYVEAHGTGTALGDPIELQALGAVYGPDRPAGRDLWTGSVKTNFGHLEGAAGVASLIKAVLILQHRAIPPSLHFHQPTPRVDWARLRLRVPTGLIPWPEEPGPDARHLVGVSSFGFSGTNAHLILEAGDRYNAAGYAADQPKVDAIGHDQLNSPTRPQLFVLSARSEEQLQALARQMVERLDRWASAETGPSLSDICLASQLQRAHLNWRLAAVATTRQELREKLASYLEGEPATGLVIGLCRPNSQPPVHFLYSGQGGQRVGMGAELYAHQLVFRQAFAACAELARPYLDRPLEDLCFGAADPGADQAVDSSEPFTDLVAAQLALFALQYALSRLWQSWGVEPALVLGQSLGEYAAAVTAGVFDLATAVQLVGRRAKLMACQPDRGNTAVVLASPEDVQPFLDAFAEQVWIAGQNAPAETVVAGHDQALAGLLATCAAAGLQVRELRGLIQAGFAMHTPLMQPVVDALVPTLAQVEMRPPALDYISSYAGRPVSDDLATPAYWMAQSRQPFHLQQALEDWLATGPASRLAVEIGPSPVLLGIARRLDPGDTPVGNSPFHPSLRQRQGEEWQMLASLAGLYAGGLDVDWDGLNRGRRPAPGTAASLPVMPFFGQPYWLTDGSGGARPAAMPWSDPIDSRPAPERWLGARLPSPLPAAQFSSLLDTNSLDFLVDHQIHDTVVVAGAAHLLRALTAAHAIGLVSPVELHDVLFAQPLILTADQIVHSQIICQPPGPEAGTVGSPYSFQIASLPEGGQWLTHVAGQIAPSASRATLLEPSVSGGGSLEQRRGRCPEALDEEAFYLGLADRGYRLGPAFRWLASIWRGEGQALAMLRPPTATEQRAGYLLHPGLLDGCLQLLSATWPAGELPTYVPYSVDRLRFYRSPITGEQLWAWAALRPQSNGTEMVAGDIQLFNAAGDMLLEVVGLHGRAITAEDLARSLQAAGRSPAVQTVDPPAGGPIYRIEWQKQPLPAEGQPAPSNGRRPTRRWLILADQAGLGQALAEALADQGQTCTLARPGDYPRQLGNEWHIRPGERADYEVLLAAAAPDRIVHLWSVDEDSTDQHTAGHSVLHLLQAASMSGQSPQLWIVTSESQPYGSLWPAAEGHAPPRASALWGFGAVVAHERPEFWGGLIDLAGEPTAEQADHLALEVLADSGEDRVLWRDGRRYVARLIPDRLPDRPPAGLPVRLRSDAAYLITGGLGALGLSLAEWLAAQGARQLILAGRRPPSAEASERIAKLAALGAKVTVGTVDLHQAAATANWWSELIGPAGSRPITIAGIFHLAGIVDDALLDQLKPDQWDQALAVKAGAAWRLHKLSAEQPLDYFVLFSSAAALLGPPGQAAYAGANAALDGLAHYRRSLGRPATTINWGPWQIGLSAQQSGLAAAWGIAPLSPDEALRHLALVLNQGWPQAAVIGGQIRASAAGQRPGLASQIAPFFSALIDQPGQPSEIAGAGRLVEQLAHAAPDLRRELLLAELQTSARRILGLTASASLDSRQPLNDYGLDSLMAVELRNDLMQLTGRSLPVTLLFDYPSLAAMADHLLKDVFRLATATEPPAAEQAPRAQTPVDLTGQIGALTEEEAAARLAQQLASLTGLPMNETSE